MRIEYFGNIAIFLSAFLVMWILASRNKLPHLTSSDGRRYLFLDGLRGIAAISVINTHIWRLAHYGFTFEGYNAQLQYNHFFGSIGVQIFFCITGFLFFDQIIKKKATFDWEKFFKARIKRLVPIYIVAISLCVIMFLCFDTTRTLKSLDYYKIMRLFFFGFYGAGAGENIGGANPGMYTVVIWTLSFEWAFYLFMPILCIIMKSTYLFITALIVSIALASTGYFSGSELLWPLFATGGVAAYIFNKGIVAKGLASHALLVVAAALVALYFYSGQKRLFVMNSYLIVSAIFVLLIIARNKIFECKVFVYLGEVSYSLYLLHVLVINIISLVSFKLFGKVMISDWNVVAIYALSSAICAYIAYLSFKYVEYQFIKRKTTTHTEVEAAR